MAQKKLFFLRVLFVSVAFSQACYPCISTRHIYNTSAKQWVVAADVDTTHDNHMCFAAVKGGECVERLNISAQSAVLIYNHQNPGSGAAYRYQFALTDSAHITKKFRVYTEFTDDCLVSALDSVGDVVATDTPSPGDVTIYKENW